MNLGINTGGILFILGLFLFSIKPKSPLSVGFHFSSAQENKVIKYQLSELSSFKIGQSLTKLKLELSTLNFKKIKTNDDYHLYKVYFPLGKTLWRSTVYLQIKNDVLIDLLVSFPSDFQHDLIHIELRAMLGTEKEFFKRNQSSLYLWENQEKIIHLYEATCTLTCFPVYWATWDQNQKDKLKEEGYKTILESLNLSTSE
jgi:hypothetical protein